MTPTTPATLPRFVVTVWHGALLLVVVMGLFIALVAATERFIIGWHAPALIPLIAILAVEAMATHWLVVRERQSMEEQLKVRGLELLVVIVVVRLWSLAAQGEPLIDTLIPWLRDPLRFFGGRFLEYMIWAVLAWIITTVLYNDVLDWGRGAYVSGINETSIERDLLQQEWDETVARYRRRYVTLLFVMLAAATVATYGGTPLRAVNASMLVVTSICAVVAGLMLQSEGRLSLLRRSWTLDEIDVDAGVGRRWGRLGMLLILTLVLLAPLVGAAMLVAPPPPLVPVLNVILVGMTLVVSLVLLLLSILLSPLVYLLSFLSGSEGPPPAPSMPDITPPQIRQVPGERPLLPALIFWGCIALLVAYAVVRYVRGHSAIGEALRRWRIFRWLQATVEELWGDARGWAALAATTLRRMRRRRPRQRTRGRAKGVRAQLRVLYRRMRGAGARRGVDARVSQTPYEYSAQLAQSMRAAGDDIHGLTEAYVAAEYGPDPEEPSHLQQARRHWRRLQRWLLRSSSLRRRSRPPNS
jgi:hypothetical protein